MITFAGLPVKVTDAVFPDHIKVERTAIFIGRDVFPLFHAWARNPKGPDLISAKVCESLRTKRSVQVTAANTAQRQDRRSPVPPAADGV